MLAQQPANFVYIDDLAKQPTPRFENEAPSHTLSEDFVTSSPNAQTQRFPNHVVTSIESLKRSSRVGRRSVNNSNLHQVSDMDPKLPIYPDIDSSVIIVEFITFQCKFIGSA